MHSDKIEDPSVLRMNCHDCFTYTFKVRTCDTAIILELKYLIIDTHHKITATFLDT